MPKRILVIDDEQMIIDSIKTVFEDIGCEVTGCSDPHAGEQEALANDYDLIVVDLRMPERDGAAVTAAICEARPEARVLINTGYPNDPLAKQALDAGATTILRKPFEIAKIMDFLY